MPDDNNTKPLKDTAAQTLPGKTLPGRTAAASPPEPGLPPAAAA